MSNGSSPHAVLSTFYFLPSTFLLASILLKNTGSPNGRFDYAIPGGFSPTLEPGDLVEVPFRDKAVNGIVWEIIKDDGTRRVKPVTSLITKTILQPFQLPLSQWVADYYYAPLSKVVESMVPEKLWNGSFDATKHRSQTISVGNTLPRGKRQTEAWKTIKDMESLSFEALKEAIPWIGKAFLKRMVDADILTSVAGPLPAPYFRNNDFGDSDTKAHSPQPTAFTLTPSQKAALQTITEKGHTKPFLLFGPPASGKTEVYLEPAKHFTKNGKQALILVPEIALTTQLIAYFSSAFGEKIAVLHSQLNDTERCIEWERLRTGEATVAIGSRIALFAPFRELGCICVDEEHEWTYKSEQTPRYHARDVAIKLGELTNSPVIFGSATPSIESFTYAKLGKYQLLRLERIGSTQPSSSVPVETQNLASLQIPQKFLGKYRIESTRLKGWDYSSEGAYFITICTKDREHSFGEIVDGEMRNTEIGNTAQECWDAIPAHFPFIILDEFVVMPNHVHGILFIEKDSTSVETQDLASLQTPAYEQSHPLPPSNTFGPQSRNLASVIRGFKIGVTKYADDHGIIFSWQPRFYDHIIRDETSLQRIREYIRENPKNWEKDKENEEGIWL